MAKKRTTNPQWITAAGITAASVTVPIAGGIAYSALAINHAVPLPPAIDAERRDLMSPQAGMLSYYLDEAEVGRPLVLVHSVNAAASAYEMRPLVEHFRGLRPVYALDLPGFGFSERTDRVYSPALYAAALVDFLRHIGPGRGGADVVALSLGSEFAARAAQEQPELVRSLTLISPTGFTTRRRKNRPEPTGEEPHRTRSFPLWSQAFYDLLASRASIRYFLKRSFVGEPDRGLIAYDYATAHQPGARFAPLYFVSGRLFTPDIRETVYERLTCPVLVIYDQDAFVRFDTLPDVLRTHASWRAVRVAPTRGLPQFERLDATAQALDGFWQDIAERRVLGVSAPA